jgi:hypothetical protein
MLTGKRAFEGSSAASVIGAGARGALGRRCRSAGARSHAAAAPGERSGEPLAIRPRLEIRTGLDRGRRLHCTRSHSAPRISPLDCGRSSRRSGRRRGFCLAREKLGSARQSHPVSTCSARRRMARTWGHPAIAGAFAGGRPRSSPSRLRYPLFPADLFPAPIGSSLQSLQTMRARASELAPDCFGEFARTTRSSGHHCPAANRRYPRSLSWENLCHPQPENHTRY